MRFFMSVLAGYLGVGCMLLGLLTKRLDFYPKILLVAGGVFILVVWSLWNWEVKF